MNKRYQLVFNGQLLKDRDPFKVAQALAQSLRLPVEEMEGVIKAASRYPVASGLEMEAAKALRMRLAGLGAVTVIEEQQGQVPKAADDDQHRSRADEPDAVDDWPWLKRFIPLRMQWLMWPGLLLGAALSVFLLLCYIALLLGVFLGLWLPSLSSAWAGHLLGNPLLGLAVQIVVVLLSSLLLLALLKPLLSIRPRRYHGQFLSPEHEPDLHAFIEDVCERMRVPVPTRVYLEQGPVVETFYCHGPLGYFRNQIVLTLGMPLVAGMNTSQLAGLIGQTMNRFRIRNLPQANGLLLAFFSFMKTALHQPDVLDSAFLRWRQQGRIGDGSWRLWAGFARWARLPLKGCLYLMQGMFHRWIHRLVADADKVALAFCGTDGLLNQMDQGQLLSHSHRQLMEGLDKKWRESNVLPENLVQMMLVQARRYPSTMAQQLRDRQQRDFQAQAWIIPSDNLRLGRVLKQRVQGSYDCFSPAISLFQHYAKLTRRMTLRSYHHELQLPVARHQLQRVVPAQSLEGELRKRLDSQFLGGYADFVSLGLKAQVKAMVESGGYDARWQEAEQRCQGIQEHSGQIHNHLSEGYRDMVDAQIREEIMLAGLWSVWQEPRPRRNEMDYIHQQAREAENAYAEALKAQHTFLQPLGQRLAAALAKAMVQHPERDQELWVLLETLERIEQVGQPLRELEIQCLLLEILLSYQGEILNKRIRSRIEQRASDVRGLLTAIGLSLKIAAYPFKDSKKLRLMAYLLEEAMVDKSPEGEMDRGMDVLLRLPLVQKRVLVRLFELADPD